MCVWGGMRECRGATARAGRRANTVPCVRTFPFPLLPAATASRQSAGPWDSPSERERARARVLDCSCLVRPTPKLSDWASIFGSLSGSGLRAQLVKCAGWDATVGQLCRPPAVAESLAGIEQPALYLQTPCPTPGPAGPDELQQAMEYELLGPAEQPLRQLYSQSPKGGARIRRPDRKVRQLLSHCDTIMEFLTNFSRISHRFLSPHT